MRKQLTQMHVNRCSYCLLAGQIKQEYQWARERLESVKYSDNPYDQDARRAWQRDVNTLFAFVDRMERHLDLKHDQNTW